MRRAYKYRVYNYIGTRLAFHFLKDDSLYTKTLEGPCNRDGFSAYIVDNYILNPEGLRAILITHRDFFMALACTDKDTNS